MDDYDWLCMCTAEKKRVHKVCMTHRSSLGGSALRPCPHCGMGNSAAEIEHARASSRVVIIGAGAAGLAAARWLKERGFKFHHAIDGAVANVWTAPINTVDFDKLEALFEEYGFPTTKYDGVAEESDEEGEEGGE